MNEPPYRDLADGLELMAQALKGGTALETALKNAARHSVNPRLRGALDAMVAGWRERADIVAPMRSHPDFFQRAFIQITQVGFQTGALDKVWAPAAVAYRETAQKH